MAKSAAAAKPKTKPVKTVKPVKAAKPQVLDGLVLPRKAFLGRLELVKAAVDQQGLTGVDQAKHFIIRDDQVTAYNTMLSISASLGVKTDFQLSVNAADLLRVVKDLDDEEVSLAFDDDNLVITTATTKAGLATMALDEDMLGLIAGLRFDKLSAKGWQKLPDDFIEGIKLCSFSVSHDRADAAFTNVFVTSGEDNAMAYSTDKRRMSRYTFAKHLKIGVLLPYDAVTKLCRHKVTEFQAAGAWAHFRDESGLMFSVRVAAAEFPDCDRFFNIKGDAVNLPVDLAAALKQALVFAAGEDTAHRQAEITFGDGAVVVRTRNQRGWLERTVTVDKLKVPAKLTKLVVNPVFFTDIMQRATTMVVADNKALFSAPSFDHVLALPEA